MDDETSRSPYGERGLKYHVVVIIVPIHTSLSLRRAWIEIQTGQKCANVYLCRSPYGERGLKFVNGAREKVDEVALLTESVD